MFENMSSGHKLTLGIITLIALVAIIGHISDIFKEPIVLTDPIAQRIYAALGEVAFDDARKTVIKEIMKESCPCLDEEKQDE